MANIFSRKVQKDIGITSTKINNYTVAASVSTTIIGLILSNTTNAQITIDATLNDGTIDYYLIKNAPINVGGSLILIGGDQKVVLNTGDSIKIKSSAATSCDAIMSILEIS